MSFAIALASRRGFRILIVGFFVLTAVHILVPAKWFVLHFYSSPIILEFTGGMVIGQLYLSGVRLPSFAPMLGALVAGLWFLRAQYSQVTEWSSDYWGFGRVILCGVPAFILAGDLFWRQTGHGGGSGGFLKSAAIPPTRFISRIPSAFTRL